MSKSVNKQRDGFPKASNQSVPQQPVPLHPSFRDKLLVLWEEGQELQKRLQYLQLRFNDVMDLAKTVQVEAGQITAEMIVQDIRTGWVLPPPQVAPSAEVAPPPEPETESSDA